MAFSNPIIGGSSFLIREAIRSPNYVAGVSGWTINKDGTVEFSNGTFRGQLFVAGPSGSSVRIFNNGSNPQINFTPTGFSDPTVAAAPLSPAVILASPQDNALASYPRLRLQSPVFTQPGHSAATIFLDGESYDNTQLARVVVGGNLTVAGQNFIVNNVDQGRGWWAGITDSADSVTSAVEFVILTIGSATYKAGRRYRVEIQGRVAPSAAAAPLLQVRKTDLAGAVVFIPGRVDCSAAQEFSGSIGFQFIVGAADITTALALTLNGGGTNVRHESNQLGRGFNIDDVGIASVMPNVVELI